MALSKLKENQLWLNESKGEASKGLILRTGEGDDAKFYVASKERVGELCAGTLVSRAGKQLSGVAFALRIPDEDEAKDLKAAEKEGYTNGNGTGAATNGKGKGN